MASAGLGLAHIAFFHHWGRIPAHALELHAWTYRSIRLAGCRRNGRASVTARRSLGRAIVFGFELVVLSLVGGSWILLERTRQTALHAADTTVQNASLIVESVVNRQFLQVDGALASLPALFETVSKDGSDVDPQSARRLLQGLKFRPLPSATSSCCDQTERSGRPPDQVRGTANSPLICTSGSQRAAPHWLPDQSAIRRRGTGCYSSSGRCTCPGSDCCMPSPKCRRPSSANSSPPSPEYQACGYRWKGATDSFS